MIGKLKTSGRMVVVKQPKVDPMASSDSVVKLFRHEAAAQVMGDGVACRACVWLDVDFCG